MRRHLVLRSTAAALLLAATVGANAAPATPAGLDYDSSLAAVRTPGFAGAWIEYGHLVVALTQPSAAAARSARADVARLLRRRDLVTKPVEIRAARYSFRQLHAWYAAMKADVFALPGAVSGDIDERGNVLRFGVTSLDESAAAVTRLATAHGVPAGAVAVVRETAAQPNSLGSRIRPLIGGLSIFAASNGCTLGFMTTIDGLKGFVTNAHCTLVPGVVNGHVFFQGPIGANPPVAFEAVDPLLTSCGASCRYSDSAFAAVFDAADYSQGYIARPSSGTTWNDTDTYRIVEEDEPVVGDSVSKVGATTGLTSGSVTQTCVDTSERLVNEGVPLVNMHCQSRASYASDGGDSGSPVFRVTSGNDVALVGIHWGSGGLFSTIGNMERSTELGPMDTCAAGFAC